MQGVCWKQVPSAVELHVEQYGEGEPAIVLLHGFGGSARNWRGQVRAWKDRHKVVVFDLRGHARSAAPDDPAEYTREALVADVARVVEISGARAVVLGGLSLGAAIALEFARKPIAGATLAGLVLASFPPPSDSAPSTWALAFADAIEDVGLEAAGERFVWGGGRFDAPSARFIRQGFLEHRAHALALLLRQVLAIHPSVADLAGELALVDVPALVIAGARDLPSLAASRDLAQTMPRARLAVIRDTGHVVNLENPEAFNALVGDFLGETEGRIDGA